MKKTRYEKELKALQVELASLHRWVVETGQRVVIVFEGRDAAGKGGMIKAITQHLNPRHYRVVALGIPTETEKGQWYFQRYVSQLPTKGELVIFDRSWYNRAGVERVMGFCDETQYRDFLYACPQFEATLIHSGTLLLKFWLSVSYEEQEKRFQERLDNPLKRWKFSPMDQASRSKWQAYAQAKDEMFKHTDTRISPWNVVESDDKRVARLNVIKHIIDTIDYTDIPYPKVDMTPITPSDQAAVDSEQGRPDKRHYHYVKDIYSNK